MGPCVGNVNETGRPCFPVNQTDLEITFQAPTWFLNAVLLYMITVVIIGVTGNGIIITVQLKNRQRSSTDCLVLAMALCDLVLAGVVGSVRTMECMPSVWIDVVSDALCKMEFYIIYCTTFASTQLLSAIAFDRYRHTCRPHSRMLNARQAAMLGFFIVGNSCAICSLSFASVRVNATGNRCEFHEDRETATAIFNTILASSFMVMFVVVIVCYSRVAWALHKNHRDKVKRNKVTLDTEAGPLSSSEPQQRSSRIPLTKRTNRIGAVVTEVGNRSIAWKQNDKSRNKRSPLAIESVHSGSTQRSSDAYPSTSKSVDSPIQSPTKTNEPRRNDKADIRGTNENSASTSSTSAMFNVTDNSKVIAVEFVSSSVVPKEPTTNPVDSIPSTETEISSGNPTIAGIAADKLKADYDRINRTTKMMFLITATYTLSWILYLITGVYLSIGENKKSVLGRSVSFLGAVFYMVNSISNPVFYIIQSSVFRARVKELFC